MKVSAAESSNVLAIPRRRVVDGTKRRATPREQGWVVGERERGPGGVQSDSWVSVVYWDRVWEPTSSRALVMRCATTHPAIFSFAALEGLGAGMMKRYILQVVSISRVRAGEDRARSMVDSRDVI